MEDIIPKTDRFRVLYVLKHLWEHTEEDHPVTLVQIQNLLSKLGIDAIPKTLDRDIAALQDLGFDIIRNRNADDPVYEKNQLVSEIVRNFKS